jgi:hypothetical protein
MKLNLKIGATFALLCATVLFSCKKDEDEYIPGPGKQVLVLTGEITGDVNLTPANDYVLKGRVFVKNGNLKIAAGTLITVAPAEQGQEKGALIITRGSKLIAEGTAADPVVFTSAATNKAPGDWTGIIILGKAATNGPSGVMHVAGMEPTADTEFGGTVTDDNSGSLKYLRVEYTGGTNPADEVEWEVDYASGLMLGGVGTGTSLDHVMVKHSKDDGFQFVGGTVNGKYLISYDNGDDNFDFDRGYTGSLQFIISYRPAAAKVGIRANGVESLNDFDATEIKPYTHPILSNMTIIGPGESQVDGDQSQGIYIRKNTRFSIQNSIIAGYTHGGLMLCPKTKPLLINNAVTDGSDFRYNLVNADNIDWAFNYDNGPTGIVINPDAEVAGYAIQPAKTATKTRVNNNAIVGDIAGFNFASLYTAGSAPDFRPQTGSPALNGSSFAEAAFTKMQSVPFRGALNTTDTWANSGKWANWD